jgi:hypothetical protein
MEQILHDCATTTEALRPIQNSQGSLRALTERYGINQKTVAKWKQRETVADVPTGPRKPSRLSLSIEEEPIIVAFRRWTRWISGLEQVFPGEPTKIAAQRFKADPAALQAMLSQRVHRVT